MKMSTIQIINSLKMNGFTEYESKIYISLLGAHPSNGNMIALSSGVPGPKVYESLRRMQEKGYVYAVSGGDKSNSKSYSPMPYKDLLKNFETGFLENYNLLEKEFEAISTSGDPEWMELFHMEGYETSIQAIKEEINRAESQILLSGWSKDVALLFDELVNAHERGVKIVSIIFDTCSKEIPWVNIKHFSFKSAIQRHEGELNIVVDTRKVIILESLSELDYAVVSTHRSMVNATVNYIRHDIYLNKVILDFKDILIEKYGENVEGLIDWF